ncbi:hypothetical protein GJ496_011102 [Pomphorhynchus laevis]|nr:hypothetical protein GJ496_011102 [Pomphorhynchus laevis]
MDSGISLDKPFQEYIQTVSPEIWKKEVELQCELLIDSMRSLNRQILALKVDVMQKHPEYVLLEEVKQLRERVSKQDTLLSTVKSKLDEWRAYRVISCGTSQFVFRFLDLKLASNPLFLKRHINAIVVARSYEYIKQICARHADQDKPVVFIQFTDTHLSNFHDPSRISDLRVLIKTRISVIQPDIVILSGDITDSFNKRHRGTQIETEWQAYNSLLNENSNQPWYDVRGNHDVFNVKNWHSPSNLYRIFSSKPSSTDRRLNQVVIEANNKTYFVTTIDTTLEPGIGASMNFFGFIPDRFMNELNDYVEKASKMATGGPPVFIGHHPLAFIHINQHKSLKEILSVNAIYMCGHLHTMSNLVPQMYYKHNPKLIELELADWKYQRKYRICVWDKGLFAFADIHAADEIAVIVTSPKMPGLVLQRELDELNNMKFDEFRLLVFSFTSPVYSVSVMVDNNIMMNCKQLYNKHPLWSAKWTNSVDISGRNHQLQVNVKLNDGTEFVRNFEMCIGCDEYTYGFGAMLALNFIKIRSIQITYIILIVIHIALIVTFRIYQLDWDSQTQINSGNAHAYQLININESPLSYTSSFKRHLKLNKLIIS